MSAHNADLETPGKSRSALYCFLFLKLRGYFVASKVNEMPRFAIYLPADWSPPTAHDRSFVAHSLHKLKDMVQDSLPLVDQNCAQDMTFLNLSSPDEHSYLVS
jgi:hypothetical protein